jgi:hypothetical protein
MTEFAFPLHNHGAQTLGMHLSGMTLRDYFAAKAMQGIMMGQFPITKKADAERRVALAAYILADAMMDARQS